jgi:hypothetical protein
MGVEFTVTVVVTAAHAACNSTPTLQVLQARRCAWHSIGHHSATTTSIIEAHDIYIYIYLLLHLPSSSRCDVWLALKASLPNSASCLACSFREWLLVPDCKQQPSTPSHPSLRQTESCAWICLQLLNRPDHSTDAVEHRSGAQLPCSVFVRLTETAQPLGYASGATRKACVYQTS